MHRKIRESLAAGGLALALLAGCAQMAAPSNPVTVTPAGPSAEMPAETPMAPTLTAAQASTPTGEAISLAAQITDDFGVLMALVPAGPFEMGSDQGLDDEKPVHTVSLDAFYIDIYKVTNALYAECVAAGACTPPACDDYAGAEYADHPVVCVGWSEARAYCQWRGGDLPSEAQWEKSARGGLQGALYPWGDEAPVCTPGAVNGAQFDACGDESLPVSSFGPNGYGLFDMAGNVWEWVLDWYDETYYASSPAVNPYGPLSGQNRVLRGGSWSNNPAGLRVAYRYGYSPLDWNGVNAGLRCARSP